MQELNQDKSGTNSQQGQELTQTSQTKKQSELNTNKVMYIHFKKVHE
nr:hypothetical protein [Mycoplasmopsis bovis]